MTLAIATILYTLIFYIVPEAPDSPFYLELDAFLNRYLLGGLMPEFSPEFYFSMKVAWCLALPYQLMVFVILQLVFCLYLKPEGMRISRYLGKYETFTSQFRLGISLYMMIVIAVFYYFSIFPYAYESTSALTVIRWVEGVFYGNFFTTKLLFLFAQVFIIPMFIYALALFFYYSFFVKEN